jgi:uncharacterized protein (DUF952 family)
MKNRWIYHLSRKTDWFASNISDLYCGSKEDQIDGFLHFSTAKQVIESASKHRAGETDLLLLEIDSNTIKSSLRWETARNGDLFPHLYGPLDKSVINRVVELSINSNGNHVFPSLKDESL